MPSAVNIALLGAGQIGSLHAETIAHHLPGARLAAVYDPAGERARTAASLADGAVVCDDPESLLASPGIDAVVIAGPTRVHAPLIAAAARAGKHVFCEKPIALALDEAREAAAAVETAGVKLQIGFQRRFDTGYVQAREALAGGDLGEIELLASTTRDPKPPPPGYLASCGGMFLDTAIHDFDSVRFLSGSEVVEVYATASSLVVPEREGPDEIDTTVTVLRLASGALASVTNSLRTGYGYEAGAEVFGSRGKLIVSSATRQVERFDLRGVSTAYPASYRERFADAYRAELAEFVRSISADTPSPCGADDGVAALTIALAARESALERRTVRLRGT